MSTELPASENQSLYDEKHRKIILKETLVGSPVSSSETKEIPSSPQDDSWTQHNWQKAGSAHVPQRLGKGKKAWKHQPQVKQPNRLQKKLEEALAKPVQLTIAESMMQKMGWQGGALGKKGTGIMEPVAPNAAYAVKTRGFGQASHTPDPPPPKKKKITPHNLKKKNLETFRTNALHQILEFVKKDYESEIVFDKHLFRNERKQIHHLVNEVINDNDVASLDSVAMMDLVQEIRAHNYYVLCTESQGSYPDRYLCLSKEAPEHVYLITPKDLREQCEDDDELDEKSDENSTNNQNNETQDNVNKDLKDSSIPNEMVKEGNINVNKNVHTEHRDNSQSLIKESETIHESVNKEVEVNVTSSMCEAVKKNSDLKNNDNTEFEVATSSKVIKNNITHTDTSNELKIDNVNLNDKVDKDPKDSNSLNDSLKESSSINENVNKEFKNNDESISKDREQNQNIDVTEKIIEYFKEFAESEECSELRFLGPFTTEEKDHINKLVSNLYYHVNHSEDKVEEMYKEVLKGLDEERYIFEVKEDINWSPVIHKTDSHKGKRKNTKDHIFFEEEES